MRNALPLLVISLCLPALAAAADPPIEWIDASTGYRVTRLSTEPGTQSLYFNYNSITSDGKFVIVSSPSGISSIEIATRVTKVLVPGKDRLLFVGRKTNQVYFARSGGKFNAEQQAPTTIFAVSHLGGTPREIATLAKGSIQSINADETFLLGVSAERDFELESGPRDPKFDANYAAKGKDGQPLTFALAKEVRLDDRAEAKIPMELFTIDTETGARKVIHSSTAWLNHLQFSPTDPSLLIFCHEGPWHKVDRIWSMRLGDKTPRVVHKRTMNMEIAGHEFFDVNGKTIWYDLQTPRGEVFWLSSADPDGSNRRWYHLDRDQWSVHFNIAPNGKFFVGDGGDSEMVAHAKDGKWLYLFRPEVIPDVAGISAPNAKDLIHPGVLRFERLVDMKAHDYRMEPNMILTPDSKHVIFRSNMHGVGHVYKVDLDKPKP